MSKKSQRQYNATRPSVPEKKTEPFYFGKQNYRLMLIGLGLLVIGFFLMMGPDANTRPDGTWDPTYWNDGIFSIVRVRIAPLLVVAGFVVQVFAIMKRGKIQQ
ncbi:MAG: DUF3098 domain-containing protein [Chryseobacterium sp.]|nr:MAG: DUF3098 domain-containing protein [Chryseobacterium sp.]